jgi:hypothetical protein
MMSHLEMYFLGKERYQGLLHQAEEIRQISRSQKPKAKRLGWFNRSRETGRPTAVYRGLAENFFHML